MFFNLDSYTFQQDETLERENGGTQRIKNPIRNHTIEFVNRVKDVFYVSDPMSFSANTTKESVLGLHAPIILIVGGYDNSTDYSFLAEVVSNKVRTIIYLGDKSEKILDHVNKNLVLFFSASSLEEAVNSAYLLGTPGTAVLFSQACSTDNTFDNYKSRNYEYKRLVNQLIYK